jgi:hypothetical protein
MSEDSKENMSIISKAEAALKEAVAGVIADHKKSGDPIVVWRDGAAVSVPADKIKEY